MSFLRGNEGRTEKATAKRRAEARRKGQIARSQTLASSVVLLGLFALLGTASPFVVRSLSAMLSRTLSGAAPQEMTPERLQQILTFCALETSKVVFIFTGAAFVLSIGANIAQGGISFSTYRLGLHFENINPAAGLKRLFPSASGVELLKNVLTLGIVVYFGHSIYQEMLGEFPRLILMPPMIIAVKTGGMVYRFAVRSALYLVVLALCDFLWKRHQFERDLRMTKQEVRDEAKSAEGSPETRSRIRRKQREVAMRRMMTAVPKADVVITNPTHFAVALAYKPGHMAAPIVLAKGQDYVALRIRKIAEDSKVPLVENKPLAQTLYKLVDIGETIPGELFKAVAEVLAYVYKLKKLRF